MIYAHSRLGASPEATPPSGWVLHNSSARAVDIQGQDKVGTQALQSTIATQPESSSEKRKQRVLITEGGLCVRKWVLSVKSL